MNDARCSPGIFRMKLKRREFLAGILLKRRILCFAYATNLARVLLFASSLSHRGDRPVCTFLNLRRGLRKGEGKTHAR